MPKTYITFGQEHRHKVKDKTLDKDTVAVFEATNKTEGRKKAFELFGPKFCFEYHDKEWDESKMHYFPKGYVNLDEPCDHYFISSGGKYSSETQVTCQFCNETRFK